MMKITGLSHLFKWENLHNWWLTKYFFAPLYIKELEVIFTSLFSNLDYGHDFCHTNRETPISEV